MRWLTSLALIVPAITACTLGAGLYWVDHKDFASLAAQRIAHATGRNVEIHHLHVRAGLWLTADLEGLSIANIPGGSRPQMITLDTLHAQIRLTTLLHGPVQSRDVIITGFSGIFERTPERQPNWRFAPADAQPGPTNTDKPENDAPDTHWFPGIRDVRILKSDVTYRSAGGSSYDARLDNMHLSSQSDTSPLLMTLAGAYNGTPVAIDTTMASIAMLRLSPRPYEAKAKITSGDLEIGFDGTLTDVLNVDGIKGHITVKTPTSRPLLDLAGLKDFQDTIPMEISGNFSHLQDNWHLEQTSGQIKGTVIKDATFDLEEGNHTKPDDIHANISLGALDVNSMLAGLSQPKGKKPTGRAAHTDIPLQVPLKPDPLLNIRLSATQVTYNDLSMSGLALNAEQAPGKIVVHELSLGYLGTTIRAQGSLKAARDGTDIDAQFDARHGDIDRLRKAAGFAPIPVKGKLGIQVIASARNAHTLNEATRKADLSAAVSMEQGEIAREIVEAASMDLRLIFRRPKGTVPITCLLGVMELHQGIGTVAPLRIRTSIGIVAAKASFDLNRHWFDLVFASRPFSTGFFALDIPVRVKGPFDSPQLSLAALSKQGKALLAESNTVTTLPPALRSFASGNACLRPTR